jgi:CYTH domain-containing protein
VSAELEIERKYLLRALPEMPRVVDVLEIDQGYLPGERLVERLRRQRSRDGTVAYFRTVKMGSGLQRLELEEETTQPIFEHLWQLTDGRRLRKRRHLVPSEDGDRYWEIDEFVDRELVLAEMELDDIASDVRIPAWLASVLVREVTTEKEYTNRSLAR